MILLYGNRGLDVMALQLLLKHFGYELKADGIFGRLTENAVEDFQIVHEIDIDGIVGLQTIREFCKGDKLLSTMIQVESEGKDSAIGDLTLKNKAYGCLQIRQGVVDEVNSKLGTRFKAEHCLNNRILSVLIWYTYWKIYPNRDDEDKAKSWNGGPYWRRYYGKVGKESYTKNLDTYWSKVKKLLV